MVLAGLNSQPLTLSVTTEEMPPTSPGPPMPPTDTTVPIT